MDRQTDRHDLKHYLLTTLLAGSNIRLAPPLGLTPPGKSLIYQCLGLDQLGLESSRQKSFVNILFSDTVCRKLE